MGIQFSIFLSHTMAQLTLYTAFLPSSQTFFEIKLHLTKMQTTEIQLQLCGGKNVQSSKANDNSQQ